MFEVLVGFVVDYDSQEGRARMRIKSPLKRGDHVHIVGGNTNKELTLKTPRLYAAACEPDAEHREIDVLSPPVEPGDMVFRVVNARVGQAQAQAEAVA